MTLLPLIAIVLLPGVPSVDGSKGSTPLDRAARAEASSALSSAVQRSEALGPDAALVVLRAAADVAVAELGGQRAGWLIDAAVGDARWLALVDVEGAAAELSRALESFATDLVFEPLIEAPLPAGWPRTTALHEIELLSYPAYRGAQTAVGGAGGNGAFWQLFRHIQNNGIAMTAPVEMTLETAPGSGREASMAFLYESTEQASEVASDAVAVVDSSASLALSIGLRGSDGSARVAEARAELEAFVAGRPDLTATGPARVLGYNSPMVPRARRFFEVQLPVRRVSASDPATL